MLVTNVNSKRDRWIEVTTAVPATDQNLRKNHKRDAVLAKWIQIVGISGVLHIDGVEQECCAKKLIKEHNELVFVCCLNFHLPIKELYYSY